MNSTKFNEKLAYAFTVDRPLTDEERQNQLQQKKHLDLDPLGMLYIIRTNFVFVETVDKLYRAKGLLTAGMALIALVLLFPIISTPVVVIRQFLNHEIDNSIGAVLAVLLAIVLPGAMGFICYWLFKQDTFTWTHYPIRLNRKTRMVHVFKMDGSILSVPWDEIFFTLARAQKFVGVQFWNISGRVLDKDGITVRDNFSFGYETNQQEHVLQFWEYLRRFMEEGPLGLPERLVYCPPIHDRREPVLFGLWFMWMDLNGQPIGQFLMLPFTLFNWIGRMVAMRTCKIPQWPKEVEDTCAIEPEDPCVRDWRSNPGLKALYLENHQSQP